MDYPFDPISATVQRTFSYLHPSGQFGVPLSNYLGWIITGWVLFQIAALIEARFVSNRVTERRAYWLPLCLVWLVFPTHLASGCIDASKSLVSSGASSFVIADIYEAGVAGALFSMVMPALIAIVRIASSKTLRGQGG